MVLCNSGIYTGPKLDILKANYAEWLKSADLILTLASLIGYAKGTIPEPGSSEPCTLSNWHNRKTSLIKRLILSGCPR